jgi:hypothetical protein
VPFYRSSSKPAAIAFAPTSAPLAVCYHNVMTDNKTQHIMRAKELLQTAKHAAMATVNADGSPHNTPFLFLHDDALTHVYWGSHPRSQHSQNILRTGQLFVVLYDAVERGGLYIRAKAGHVVEGDELDMALAVHNNFRARFGQLPLERDFYIKDAPQRMWDAETVAFWVNGEVRGANGKIAEDIRYDITPQDLR